MKYSDIHSTLKEITIIKIGLFYDRTGMTLIQEKHLKELSSSMDKATAEKVLSGLLWYVKILKPYLAPNSNRAILFDEHAEFFKKVIVLESDEEFKAHIVEIVNVAKEVRSYVLGTTEKVVEEEVVEEEVVEEEVLGDEFFLGNIIEQSKKTQVDIVEIVTNEEKESPEVYSPEERFRRFLEKPNTSVRRRG